MNKRLMILLTAMLLALALLSGTALAAQWPEGRSPSKPYSNKPEVDLNEKMGYIILYPRDRNRMAAYEYCNTLEIYLPREDIEIGTGALRLYQLPQGGGAAVEAASVAFGSDATRVRPLSEEELQGLMWGSGVCIEITLPVSLEFGGSYYVTMEEGCFTANHGAVVSPAITNPEAWVPVLTGDYGVSGLRYSAPPAEDGQEAPAEGYKAVPEKGDIIRFDVVLGGEAAAAVIYSVNDSVYFENIEYEQSGAVQGVVTGDDLKWGVVFLNAAGEVLDAIDLEN